MNTKRFVSDFEDNILSRGRYWQILDSANTTRVLVVLLEGNFFSVENICRVENQVSMH